MAAWLGVLLHPARPWDLRPTDEEDPPAPEPRTWPPLAVLVPARNEADVLPATLPALLGQDYPGPWRVVVIDDRSADGTAGVARRAGAGDPRLAVVAGARLAEGWAGKVWALEQGRRAAGAGTPAPALLLLTDADILHAPGSLRRLVAEAEHRGLDLVSRMARLRCSSPAERLLIPPFVLFFFLLYPMRWANRPGGRLAAAAGGCVLVRAQALARAGGLEAIRGALIDDLALARAVKRSGGSTRLALSRGAVSSLRPYPDVAAVWRMVRRSAFTQLRRSWGLLVVVTAVLVLMFLVPPACVAAGIAGAVAGAAGWPLPLASGAAAWAVMATVALPAAGAFGLPRRWALALPLAGLLYALMTVDSALRGPRGGGWR
ncbi:MAG TPA: glycosyltransferase [Miltoncostaeaceae bacterium]|nr:glycosyltransferase [Miltoncostaeaceae bacterium]